MDFPTPLSDREKILNFDFNVLSKYIDTSIDLSYFIPNLSPSDDRETLVSEYYKSIFCIEFRTNSISLWSIFKCHNTKGKYMLI